MMPLTSIEEMQKNPGSLEEGLLLLDSLSRRYEEWIENEEEDGNERAGGIHASEVSGCARRLVYGIMNTKRVGQSSYIWKRRFKMGHVIHAMLQSEFARFSYSPDHFTRFQDEAVISPHLHMLAARWDINSSCDGIFEIGEKNPERLLLRAGIEIKSMNPDEFDRINKPKPEHIEQAHVYMACLNLPVMWFIYFNKANANYTKSSDRRFVIPFNQDTWDGLERRFDKAHQQAYFQQLPAKEEGIVCSFCPFSYTCQPDSLNKNKQSHNNKRFMR
jgi:CRISPR/Cas system-associated exonuclease Cas4 (RecB family)